MLVGILLLLNAVGSLQSDPKIEKHPPIPLEIKDFCLLAVSLFTFAALILARYLTAAYNNALETQINELEKRLYERIPFEADQDPFGADGLAEDVARDSAEKNDQENNAGYSEQIMRKWGRSNPNEKKSDSNSKKSVSTASKDKRAKIVENDDNKGSKQEEKKEETPRQNHSVEKKAQTPETPAANSGSSENDKNVPRKRRLGNNLALLAEQERMVDEIPSESLKERRTPKRLPRSSNEILT
ncbi:unnamed protein product, partial [Mesorhabditis spiculigera]